jgi:hypothetical protein
MLLVADHGVHGWPAGGALQEKEPNPAPPPGPCLPAGWLLVMGVYCILFLPETKGVPIEEIQEGIFMPHWFWGKVG